ncbi:MAG: hypothetical protein ABFR36_07075 [Acidobacteriota bacterium]
MKNTCLIILIFILQISFYGSQGEIIQGLNNPTNMIVDSKRIYISDFPKVKIFDRNTLSVIKEFGKKGEGPQEFLAYVFFELSGEKLIVDSQGKHSYFTRDGKYLNERKFTTGGRYKILGKHFASYGILQEGKISYQSVDIYDSSFKKIKMLYKFPYFYQGQGPLKGIHILDYYRTIALTSGGRLVLRKMDDFEFSIYNEKGIKLTSFRREYKKIKFSEKDKGKYYNFFKFNPDFRPYYESQKHLIKFYSHYPAVRDYFLCNDLIYIFTYLKESGKTEFFIYDLKGRFIKRIFANLNFISIMDIGPTWVEDDKLFQLVENEDEEEWELRTSDFR